MMRLFSSKKPAHSDHPGGEENPIRFELFSTERLAQHAISLAQAQQTSPYRNGRKLIPRVRDNCQVLLATYQTVAQAVHEQHAITPAAEWLLDNFHVLQEQVSDIYVDLPEAYYQELPKLADGVLAGYPRIYGIAWAMVAHTDSRFDPELLKLFVHSYQTIEPLTLGELWAIPITLRILLVENLRRLAVRIAHSQTGRRMADSFVDAIEQHAATDPTDPVVANAQLPEAALRQAYAVQILQRLHDPHPDTTVPLDFLTEWLAEQGVGIDEIVRREHTEQVADNLTVRNIITSMRAISAFDWPEFVEAISLVDQCLRQHPPYLAMDFLTRDRYRHAIEDLAKRSAYSEMDIARRVINKVQHLCANPGCDPKHQEPGFHLIGNGRYALEAEVAYRPTLKQRLLRSYVAHAGLSYFASLCVLTLIVLAIPLSACLLAGLSDNALVVLGIFALFPASDIAIGLINHFVIGGLPPRHLPRMAYKNGIPEHLRTFVVIPTLFSQIDDVKHQVAQMEIRYLANPDAHVYFALLSDWLDAEQAELPTDAALLATAVTAVAALNQRYQGERFFVFHRNRLWNASENIWMGWERKRGKLHEFNRLLRGATDTSFIVETAVPQDVCYVLTLDADTKLPMGTVAELVGVAAHPLNQPVFDAHSQCVVDGYGILQPRVTATLPLRQEHSVFHQLFAGACGTDAYSSSVSELYQDLFALGTFSGKGLYHLDSFMAALDGRVPDNTQLSHDLFESVFVRCALVSDIEFFEDYPSHTDVAASREHRWVRGDWQLLPWLLGLRGNGMPTLGRWKMLDNLRRSLSAPGMFFALVCALAIPDAPHTVLLSFVLVALGFPVLLTISAGLVWPSRGVSVFAHLRMTTNHILCALGNSLVALALLAQHTWLMLDAITSTLVRLVTGRQLLKWVTALQAKNASSHSLRRLIGPQLRATLMVVAVAALVWTFNPSGIVLAAPFLGLWFLAPMIGHLLSLPPRLDPAECLQAQDSLVLRLLARRIWRFFTTFVTADDHFLPPDNFQEDPLPVIAHRSSPTNFGLYLLSVIAARDFGWIGLSDTVAKLSVTLDTLKALPRYQGHFYNWYDTQSLQTLEPRYISTVDSGNLAGHLLALGTACKGLRLQPFTLETALLGLEDTRQLVLAQIDALNHQRRTLTITRHELRQQSQQLGELLALRPTGLVAWQQLWQDLTAAANSLQDVARAYSAERGDSHNSEMLVWVNLLHDDIASHSRDLAELLPASTDLSQPDAILQMSLEQLALHYHSERMRLQNTSDGTHSLAAQQLHRALNHTETLLQQLNTISTSVASLFAEMDFRFLYDHKCHLFSLGYRVAENTLDPSYYDLLASEARLASFVAIAKRDIPSSHWYHLGRRVTRAAQGTVLLSWSGSMFEYLMPSLVTFTPRYSLLDQTCRLVVLRQIAYGKERGVPWGVSESAFNTRDHLFTYQYSAFGVPGLGIKRGLGEELVIAPYATALAAMYWPHAAVENFAQLETFGALGPYGCYEALDFTPIRLAEGQTVAVVRCYMAHHQGMSLVAIANTVHDGVMRHRFHCSPLIQAADMLLQERIPVGADAPPLPILDSIIDVKEFVQPPLRRVPSPTSSVPSAHLLSNGRYAVMITAAGSGYSQWQKMAVTRWREDVTRDAWGSYLYLRDVATGRVWSAGYQPTVSAPDSYAVVFAEDRARITRCDGDITSALEIVVSPEDDAEIRRLSLTNNGTRTLTLEITSYAEIVLATLAADIAHPAFSNLFIKTEFLPHAHGLIAQRRHRDASDTGVFAAHVIAGRHSDSNLQYETDRARFIGRGQSVRAPIAVMDGRPLSNTVGEVLDPIFSLRTSVVISPGTTEHITFTTLIAATRAAVEEAIDKYHNPSTFERVSSLAWTHAHVQLHYLRTTPDEASLFQDLASRLLYTDPWLRPPSKVILQNTLNVTGLWQQGISGDRPMLVLRIAEPEDRSLVEQLLRAHEYWRMKGLAVDLIILNDKESSYSLDLQMLIEGLVRENQALSSHQGHEDHGAIFVLRTGQLAPDLLRLLQATARVILSSSKGTLAEQLLRHPRPITRYVASPALLPSPKNPPLPLPELEFFNGLGGFHNDGREYVIALNNGQWTPAPWVNVIANPEFGFMVSECGSGCTWSGNSRENQLTPWSNDPVSDTPGEVFYLLDEDSNALWTPTALPIRVDNASYVIHHGQGYSRFKHNSHGIHSELLQFVSVDDPVKISSLVLTNTSGQTRRLTVAVYVEWVLGANRSATAPHIVTELDAETNALFAYNPWDAEFGTRIAFADFNGAQTDWTGNRGEFIGRNGSLDAPWGLLGSHSFKKRLGAGLDACAVLSTSVILLPNAKTELVFLLGQGENRVQARDLIRRHRATSVGSRLASVHQQWEQVLGKVQVQTPDRQLDLMLNRWLLYQTLSCRLWARAGFYQLGGAFGFRDQLQDCLALTIARPDLSRAHLLRAAARQFVEGDVQHWWHPPSGRGVRTHFSDDRIWLAFVLAHYLKVTGDLAILNENIAFLDAPVLLPGQDDAYFQPDTSALSASLYEHCARALDISLGVGSHGLPLMGSGDWNDGMNRVGNQGKGESVWLAWFLITTLKSFIGIASQHGDPERAARWQLHSAQLTTAVDSQAWDGAWYKRAFFDDGSPLGSANNAECRIDSIAQSWAVMSGAADSTRAQLAMQSVRDYLIHDGDGLMLLFTPPFDKTPSDPGYIKSYPPGVRENGGQYTHAAVWSVMAYAQLGDGDMAMALLAMLNPIHHAASRTEVYAYKVEPYVLSADIYAIAPHTRRGGWTWYTGASGWFYRAGLEAILGLHVENGSLRLDPCIPKAWHSYRLFYQHQDTRYEIFVENPEGVTRGVAFIELDGNRQADDKIVLQDDGVVHQVRVVLGV